MRFSAKDFCEEQLIEIKKAIKQGLDIKLLANPIYNCFQMKELRMGLLHKIKIVYFANPEFNCLQMQEIRLGMEHGIDVRKYAKPKISSFKMREIREHMEIDSEVLCGKYYRKDYDFLQWCVMKYGLNNGADISRYANPSLSAGQMLDIYNTLEIKGA